MTQQKSSNSPLPRPINNLDCKYDLLHSNRKNTFNSENPSSLSDQDLHKNLVLLKSKETRVVAEIICHLQEVFRRRLFADFGCSSIYDYCIRVLGYSNGEAHRKISACKLAAQVPEVRDSIAAGELTLSNAVSVQTLVAKLQQSNAKAQAASTRTYESNPSKASNMPCRPNQKVIRQIIDRVKNKNTRECELELHKVANELNLCLDTPPPTRRNLNEMAQLKIYVNREKIDSLKLELGLSNEQDLINLLISEKLNQILETKRAKLEKIGVSRPHKLNSKARSISLSKRTAILKQAGGKCENCGATTKLQLDHKVTVSQGGGNDLSNLRVLCRPCNQRSAIKQLGLSYMDPYLNPYEKPTVMGR